MATSTNRRNFLRAKFHIADLPRPPGAVGISRFSGLCDGCGDCLDACPEGILRKDSQGLAVLDLKSGACSFCGDCIQACQTGALTEEARADWDWVARIQGGCLSLNAVACRTCQDFCDEQAIRFRLEPGGRARPLIDETACTGCGACAAACPAGAIDFARMETNELEATA
ncbi:ferredoxin-type protein NapF [Aliiruegeria lutimaris]|uniref:Ferredoxin-type protein NapF n=1 Tax=Aliiruegeria lutimaris TaxID=571298 RepID=A0A1G9APD6_9RHOB|nr:ferredoxin-type protein NapF [Aliiruegeria lutimaris]SDK29101.1 ferredoxin-type protein NapF [Aliiruegeria lutimaris]